MEDIPYSNISNSTEVVNSTNGKIVNACLGVKSTPYEKMEPFTPDSPDTEDIESLRIQIAAEPTEQDGSFTESCSEDIEIYFSFSPNTEIIVGQENDAELLKTDESPYMDFSEDVTTISPMSIVPVSPYTVDIEFPCEENNPAEEETPFIPLHATPKLRSRKKLITLPRRRINFELSEDSD